MRPAHGRLIYKLFQLHVGGSEHCFKSCKHPPPRTTDEGDGGEKKCIFFSFDKRWICILVHISKNIIFLEWTDWIAFRQQKKKKHLPDPRSLFLFSCFSMTIFSNESNFDVALGMRIVQYRSEQVARWFKSLIQLESISRSPVGWHIILEDFSPHVSLDASWQINPWLMIVEHLSYSDY